MPMSTSPSGKLREDPDTGAALRAAFGAPGPSKKIQENMVKMLVNWGYPSHSRKNVVFVWGARWDAGQVWVRHVL